jgi:2-polyprenyl-6-methoxyphenol hydroxylase-like FAD-dependent oxidoreductase
VENKKILVSGASIAGPTLAYWLNYYGFEVTVIERAEELRLGGQNIDVKGPALEVARKMGIEEQIRAANTTEQGLRFVNVKNQTIADFPKESSLSMTQENEILRGDLVKILYDATRKNVKYIFGDHITALEEMPGHVSVTFSGGKTADYDLVISAEGIGSKTRDLVFGNETQFTYKGLYTAYFTIDKTDTDSQWARWCNTVDGIVFLLRPDNQGQTRACINFLSPERGYEKLPQEDQKKLLIERISHVGWESQRLVREIEKTGDLYLDRLSQVKAPRWSKGRFAIAGDAAHCATPLAGKGTDLAMAGPYILAGELFRAAEHKEAFKAYEDKMRPYAEACQKLPPGVPRLVYPTSKPGVAVLNGFVSAAGSRFTKSVISLFSNPKKKTGKEIDLPDYKQQSPA